MCNFNQVLLGSGKLIYRNKKKRRKPSAILGISGECWLLFSSNLITYTNKKTIDLIHAGCNIFVKLNFRQTLLNMGFPERNRTNSYFKKRRIWSFWVFYHLMYLHVIEYMTHYYIKNIKLPSIFAKKWDLSKNNEKWSPRFFNDTCR